MTSTPPSGSAQSSDATPFLLKVFCRTNAFHRPEEFTSHPLPSYTPIYTFKSCTLSELSHHIAAASPSVLPHPAIGTRLVFRILFADTQGRSNATPRFTIKDLGSVVIGEGGPGVEFDEVGTDTVAEEAGGSGSGSRAGGGDGAKTLNDAKFIVGDYISCAVLPPSDITGEIAPAAAAMVGGGTGPGRGPGMLPPPVPRRGAERGYGRADYGRDYGQSYGRGDFARGGYSSQSGAGMGSRGFGGRGGRYGDGSWGGRGVPEGEWRRGERLPYPPMGSTRGRSGRGAR